MKSKGFTLVELLAVIVILAIIAIIAVPIFLGMISESKENSDKEAVNLYTDTVEKAIQKKQMSDPNFQPDKCEIQEDGNLECFSGITSLGIVKVSMKGTLPTRGTIIIDSDEINYYNINLNGKKFYPIATLVEDVAPTGLSVGDKYTYKVNSKDIFTFYVLSIEGTGANLKVNLIMDRNICNDGTVNYTETNNYCRCQWHTGANDNNYGPDTAMTNLHNGTKGWTNVPDMIMDYVDENNTSSDTVGYTSIIANTSTKVTTITGKQGNTSDNQTFGSITQPLKARLPKESEVTGAGCTTIDGSCPTWLIEHMAYYNVSNDKYSMNNNSEAYQSQIYGYWLLSSYPGNSNFARDVLFYGYADYAYTTDGNYGVRPVITVDINDLQ